MHTDQRVVITVSIGVTSLGAGLATGDIQLLETADKALYEAKHQGRNRRGVPVPDLSPAHSVGNGGTQLQLLDSRQDSMGSSVPPVCT